MKFLWFVAGIFVGATFKGEVKVSVREVTESAPRAEKGAIQLSRFIESTGLTDPSEVYRQTSHILRSGREREALMNDPDFRS